MDLITKNLTFVGSFESNFRNTSYNIYKFADFDNYRVMYFSSEKKYNLELGLVYKCVLEFQNNKFKITDVK